MKLFSDLSRFKTQWFYLFLIYVCIYFMCFSFLKEGFHSENISENSHVNKYLNHFINAIHFSLSTSLTIGYGDIYPNTWWSKLLTISQALFLIHFIVK
jgi:hypothetical protein